MVARAQRGSSLCEKGRTHPHNVRKMLALLRAAPLSPCILIIFMSASMEAVGNEMKDSAGTCTKSYLVTRDIL
eukprot:4742258-Pyramimonas_sp.AAC.1